MIVEERIYTLKVGKIPELFKAYEQHGLAAQKRILGGLVGYYSVEAGPLNTIVHMWAYEDMVDRAKRRAQLAQDPDFKEYLAKTAGLVERQENRILVPAPFFEKTFRAVLEAARHG
jgi:NIPSNAP protein